MSRTGIVHQGALLRLPSGSVVTPVRRLCGWVNGWEVVPCRVEGADVIKGRDDESFNLSDDFLFMYARPALNGVSLKV